ncbi:MAG: hypothetical protein H7062_03550 [Candidatus Saccharimonas sp.]|nr:hypothetical protein [Planctomycetaceae bacterium]
MFRPNPFLNSIASMLYGASPALASRGDEWERVNLRFDVEFRFCFDFRNWFAESGWIGLVNFSPSKTWTTAEHRRQQNQLTEQRCRHLSRH